MRFRKRQRQDTRLEDGYLQNAPFDADTAVPAAADGKTRSVEARYRVTWHRPEQPTSASIVRVILNATATVDVSLFDPDGLTSSVLMSPPLEIKNSEVEAEAAMRIWIASRRREMPQGTIARCELLGLSGSI